MSASLSLGMRGPQERRGIGVNITCVYPAEGGFVFVRLERANAP
jgi:hypothetical protein